MSTWSLRLDVIEKLLYLLIVSSPKSKISLEKEKKIFANRIFIGIYLIYSFKNRINQELKEGKAVSASLKTKTSNAEKPDRKALLGTLKHFYRKLDYVD